MENELLLFIKLNLVINLKLLNLTFTHKIIFRIKEENLNVVI